MITGGGGGGFEFPKIDCCGGGATFKFASCILCELPKIEDCCVWGWVFSIGCWNPKGDGATGCCCCVCWNKLPLWVWLKAGLAVCPKMLCCGACPNILDSELTVWVWGAPKNPLAGVETVPKIDPWDCGCGCWLDPNAEEKKFWFSVEVCWENGPENCVGATGCWGCWGLLNDEDPNIPPPVFVAEFPKILFVDCWPAPPKNDDVPVAGVLPKMLDVFVDPKGWGWLAVPKILAVFTDANVLVLDWR